MVVMGAIVGGRDGEAAMSIFFRRYNVVMSTCVFFIFSYLYCGYGVDFI